MSAPDPMHEAIAAMLAEITGTGHALTAWDTRGGREASVKAI